MGSVKRWLVSEVRPRVLASESTKTKRTQGIHAPVRVTTVGRRLLDLDGITVIKFDFEGEVVIAEVRLRRRRLACPRCGFTTRARYDTRDVDSHRRGLDLGRRRVMIRALTTPPT